MQSPSSSSLRISQVGLRSYNEVALLTSWQVYTIDDSTRPMSWIVLITERTKQKFLQQCGFAGF